MNRFFYLLYNIYPISYLLGLILIMQTYIKIEIYKRV